MARQNNQQDKRRTSLFTRTPLRGLTTISDGLSEDEEKPRLLSKTKRRTNSHTTDCYSPMSPIMDKTFATDDSRPPSPIALPTRPSFSSLTRRTSMRPSSVFGSFRSLRSSDDNDEPLSSVSSTAPSVNWGEIMDMNTKSRTVLQHGEVQTGHSLFRKKKEYLVLTETHLYRLKNAAKAAELFNLNTSPRQSNIRHVSTFSSSSTEMEGHSQDNSNDREIRVPLRQVVAVYRLEDGRPWFAIELAYLDDESSHAACMTLQFGDPDERDTWLSMIRSTANEVCLADENPISESASHRVARAVERERDYDPLNYAVYKVVQRPSGKQGNRSTEDLSKIASTICFLAIGVYKVHIIPLFNPSKRNSSTSLTSLNTLGPYGILTMTNIRLSMEDDAFELSFRMPFSGTKTLHLASLASQDIAVRLRQVEEYLRPEWETRPYTFNICREVENRLARTNTQAMDEGSLDRTLVAYCAAYNCSPENIRYRISETGEDAPRFELLQPAQSREPYRAHELLAIMRSLRYHESFVGLSFAGVSLDLLSHRQDHQGAEHVCRNSKRGTPIRMTKEELEAASILIQEIRALAVTNKRLRRIDFSGCFRTRRTTSEQRRDLGCEVVEALMPLCRLQATNVDWITLNRIQLSETDLGYLVSAADDKSCHFRAIDMSDCGLTDRNLSVVLDALAAQESTLEAMDISSNNARLDPFSLNSQLIAFPFIRKLNLSGLARTAGNEPLLSEQVLFKLRLQELCLNGTPLNKATIDVISRYLEIKPSEPLKELRLDRTCLSGHQAAQLMRSMASLNKQARRLHLDISENNLHKDHKAFCKAIADGCAPAQLSIRLLDYEDDDLFRELVLALSANATIEALDMSRASLPQDASLETCEALERMFAHNDTMTYLDISGEETRLESSKLGVGINRSLKGLASNKALRVLSIQRQKLGLRGANTLAEVLRVNDVLQELHCANNNIPLGGLTDMVNALRHNTTLLYLSPMTESRDEHVNKAKAEVRAIQGELAASSTSSKRRSMAIGPTLSTRIKHPVSSRVSSREKSPVGPLPLTEQDIGAALRLVEENWDRQAYRLRQYLERNYCIAHGISVPMQIENDDYDRENLDPDIIKLLEDANFDQTPKIELTDPMVLSRSPPGRVRGKIKKDLRGASPIEGPGRVSPLREIQDAFVFAKQNFSLTGLTSFGSH